MFRFTFFLSQLESQVVYLFPNQPGTISHLLQLSSAFWMCGILVAPLSGLILNVSQGYHYRILQDTSNKEGKEVDENHLYCIHIRGIAPGFLIMAIFASIMSGLVFVPHKVAFYCAFICLVIVRSLLFSSVVGFCLTAFPIKYFGSVYGLMNTLGGIFGLIIYGLLRAPENIGNGIAAALTVGLFITPLSLIYKARS